MQTHPIGDIASGNGSATEEEYSLAALTDAWLSLQKLERRMQAGAPPEVRIALTNADEVLAGSISRMAPGFIDHLREVTAPDEGTRE
jgi:hypothetical protein